MRQTWASQINSVIPNQWNWFDVRHTDWSDIKLRFGSAQSQNFGLGSVFRFVLNLKHRCLIWRHICPTKHLLMVSSEDLEGWRRGTETKSGRGIWPQTAEKKQAAEHLNSKAAGFSIYPKCFLTLKLSGLPQKGEHSILSYFKTVRYSKHLRAVSVSFVLGFFFFSFVAGHFQGN